MKTFLIASGIFIWVLMAIMPARLAIMQEAEENGYDSKLVKDEYILLRELADTPVTDTDARTQILMNYANLCVCREHYDRADLIYRQIWQERSKLNLPYDKTLVSAMVAMAEMDRDMGALDESVSCYQTVYDYDYRRLPQSDAKLIRDLNNLGLIYYLKGKGTADKTERLAIFQKGQEHLSAAIARQRQIYGPDSQAEGKSLSTMGFLLRDMGRAAESRQALQRAGLIEAKITKVANAP